MALAYDDGQLSQMHHLNRFLSLHVHRVTGILAFDAHVMIEALETASLRASSSNGNAAKSMLVPSKSRKELAVLRFCIIVINVGGGKPEAAIPPHVLILP